MGSVKILPYITIEPGDLQSAKEIMNTYLSTMGQCHFKQETSQPSEKGWGNGNGFKSFLVHNMILKGDLDALKNHVIDKGIEVESLHIDSALRAYTDPEILQFLLENYSDTTVIQGYLLAELDKGNIATSKLLLEKLPSVDSKGLATAIAHCMQEINSENMDAFEELIAILESKGADLSTIHSEFEIHKIGSGSEALSFAENPLVNPNAEIVSDL